MRSGRTVAFGADARGQAHPSTACHDCARRHDRARFEDHVVLHNRLCVDQRAGAEPRIGSDVSAGEHLNAFVDMRATRHVRAWMDEWRSPEPGSPHALEHIESPARVPESKQDSVDPLGT